MELKATSALLVPLKGTPMMILLAMLCLDRPTGRNELMTATGYSAPTVQRALTLLAARGLARRRSRYNGWVLTPGLRRMLLRLGLALAVPEEPPAGLPYRYG